MNILFAHTFYRFATKKSYVLIHGLVGAFYSATVQYLNGTITTLEKRYKIPSRNTGIIIVGYDATAIFMAPLVSYYFAKKHRPRWIAFGVSTIALATLGNSLLHFMHGPGEDALNLTLEYGATLNNSDSSLVDEFQEKKTLCQLDCK